MMMLAVTDASRCLTRPRVSPRASRHAAMPPAAAAVRARSSVKHAGLALSSTRRATAVRATSGDVTTSSEDEAKRRYVNFTGFPFPLVPFLSRRTVLREVVKGKVWTLEQEQGIGFDLGVSTNVRCTIVKMRDGRLWVHDPVAPTVECLEMIESIGGDVAYVVLATTQYEHKVFAGPFARKFPGAEVWIAPGQFSFPLNLPNEFFGIFPTGTIADDDMPWSSEIETKLLRLPSLFWGNYTYCEAAFYHADSKSVLVTDAAVFVDRKPPDVIPYDSLVDLGAEDGFTISLLRAVDFRGGRTLPGAGATRADPKGCASVGWKRMALFSLFIAPDAKNILKPSSSFEGMAGKFVVSPIVYEIVFQFYRSEVRTWAEDVGRWRDARRVISAHFPICEGNNNMIGNPFNRGASPVARFVRAFDWAKSTDAAPVEYVDRDDLASLELVVGALRFIRAVPVPTE